MTFEPKHGLSDCLRRRLRDINRNDDGMPPRDFFIASLEEAASLIYWIRIADELEHDARLGSLADSADGLMQRVINIVQAYDERMEASCG